MVERRGQFFASDFIFSIALFLFVLLAVIVLWNQLQSGIETGQDKSLVSVVAYAASDALVLSPGFPDDWTSLNVSSIGLAKEPRVIDVSKFVELRQMSYDDARFLTGLGRYDFRLSVTNNGSVLRSGVKCFDAPVAYFADADTDFFDLLNGNGVVWDLYCAAGSACESLSGDFRDKHVEATQGAALGKLFENQDIYGTIVVAGFTEEVRPEDVGNASLFLSSGGALFYEGGGNSGGHLLSFLNMTAVREGVACDGNVSFLGNLLRNASVGDVVSFGSCDWRFVNGSSDRALARYVSPLADQNSAFVGSWEYGAGTVYYVADVNSVFGAVLPGKQVINFAGQPLEFGSVVGSAEDVFVSRRPVVVDSGGREKCSGSFDLVVWRSR